MPAPVEYPIPYLSSDRIWLTGGKAPDRLLVYEIDKDEWRFSAALPMPDFAVPDVRTPDGLLRAFGGWSHRRQGAVTDTAAFDPVEESWHETEPMPEPARDKHANVVLSDGRVFVMGGAASPWTDDAALVTATLLYDPANDSWQDGGRMHQGRTDFTQTLLADGRVLVTGGADEGFVTAEYEFETFDHCEIYDPRTKAWTEVASLSLPRQAHRATLLLDGRILVTGGAVWGPDGYQNIAAGEIYDLETDVWMTTTPMSIERRRHDATRLEDGRVLVTGGGTNSGNTGAAEIFDTKAETWSPAGALSEPRRNHAGVILDDGAVLFLGGSNDCQCILDVVETFTPR